MSDELNRVLLIFKSGAKTTVSMTDREIELLQEDGPLLFKTPILGIVRTEVAFMEVLK